MKISHAQLLAVVSASLLCADSRFAAAADLAAPTMRSDTNAAAVIRRADLYHDGWIDLNRNGAKDVYEDSTAPIETRIADLLGRMNEIEKIGQLWQRPLADAKNDAPLIARGEIGSYLGVDLAGPKFRDELQRVAIEESRLGIPLIFGYDTIHGFRTVFPIPLALSCSWEPDLLERVSAIAARESRAAGINWTFAPMVDIARDPRWGRIAEGNGEDPWLGQQFAIAAVRGFQGSNAAAPNRVAACLKHYVGYGAAEGGRDYNTTEIGISSLRNIYLPPFKAGIDAGALTIMSAFNALNGIPTSGNYFTLTEILRNEWKFDGTVVSDYDSVRELIRHGYAEDESEAARLGLSAGVDIEMVSDTYRQNLAALVRSNSIPQETLDEAVRRVLRLKFRCGLFDHPYTPESERPYLRADALKLAREAAAKSVVLVKNVGDLLPLKRGSRIALIGPYGDSHDLLGCWPAVGQPGETTTLATALRSALGTNAVIVSPGAEMETNRTDMIAAAVEAAQRADVILLAIGEPAKFSGEAHSRQTLNLPGAQELLVERICALDKPVIAVVFTGRPLSIPTVLEKCGAVLIAWHPGVQGAEGLTDVLTGETEPIGRLTVSWPRTIGQIPMHYNYLATSRTFTDEYGSHYLDGPRTPLLPFGSGFGYTAFTIGNIRVSATNATPTKPITASAVVRNTGKRSGRAVVQLYIRDHAASGGARPVRELRGFERVELPPGQQREVSFQLDDQALGYWLPNGKWVAEPGRFSAWIGFDSTTTNGASFLLGR